MTAQRVLGIGELLWDLFPTGPRLGGAPFNVTANLRRLGHDARFATVVGDDDRGREALAAAVRLGVDSDLIGMSSAAPTGVVTVDVDKNGGPTFRIASPAAYELLALSDAQLAAIVAWAPAALVIGTLAQRFRSVHESTLRVIDAARMPIRLYDVNLRDGCWSERLVLDLLALATVVKTNHDEARILGGLLGTATDLATLGEALAARYGTKAFCVTRGANGAALWLEGTVFEADAIPIVAVDAVGAGDAFAAGLLDGLLRGATGAETLDRANRLGAIVASRAGAIPDWTTAELVTTS